jgi:hypothetical protein
MCTRPLRFDFLCTRPSRLLCIHSQKGNLPVVVVVNSNEREQLDRALDFLIVTSLCVRNYG